MSEPDDDGISKDEWEREVETLRTELLALQQAVLARAEFPVLVLVHGVDGAGKSETVRWLTEWMDPRHIRSYAYDEPTSEERQRPALYRYMRRLPPKGSMAVYFGSWYSDPLGDRTSKRIDRQEFQGNLESIVRLETMLAAEGVLILKFWFDLSRKALRRRLEDLESDEDTAYRVTKREWAHYENLERFREVAGDALRATDLPEVPWHFVNGTDVRGAGLTVGRVLRDSIRARLDEPKSRGVQAKRSKPAPRSEVDVSALRGLDFTRSLDDAEYEKELEDYQKRLALLSRKKRFGKISPVIVFEGMDAAGKGGAIRRLTHALDPRRYELVPIAAPTDEERAQPYLWRFWRHAPSDGHCVIFDRSWYGRVLVERVEGYCSESDWRRAYDEINDFESHLTEAGNVVVKFWLQVSLDEQLRRFEERETTAWKNFKIGPDDWRNRKKWPAYEVAASEMFARTSTELAPWTIVPANDKRHARIEVLRTTVRAIERALEE